MSSKKLMNFALSIGEVMLRSGAETYRVEDSINRILATSSASDFESFVTPTGLFASLDTSDGNHQTYIRRVDQRSIHLYKIEAANEISRQFCSKTISLDQAITQLETVKNAATYNKKIIVFGTSMAAGLFAFMLSGTWEDALVTLIAGLVLSLFKLLFDDKKISKFFIDLIGGFLTTTTSLVILHLMGFGNHQDIILVSAIMPLVPGVAITNAIRDTLHGHLVSGSARILDAFIVAASIASGVGIALSLFNDLFGGVIG